MKKLLEHIPEWIKLFVIVAFLITVIVAAFGFFVCDQWEKVDAVVIEKNIKDSEPGVDVVFTNGNTQITLGGPNEYKILLASQRSERWFTVTREEYDSLQFGTFVTIWERRSNTTEGYVYLLQLKKHDQRFDGESQGELLDVISEFGTTYTITY